MKISKLYASRKDLYMAGLHNSYQRGIGRAKDGTGSMSIVLSGGYVDDQDSGDIIIYTGEGGRDPNTGLQIADQVIRGGNKDLVEAYELGTTVYVTRGSQHNSQYSPLSGYAFAGTYLITKHWIEKGQNGFNILRFELDKVEDADEYDEGTTLNETQRVEYTATRIIRDTKLAKKIKEMYDYKCQVCDVQIGLPTGSKYAEGAHIWPLGKPHNGPDIVENLLCLCPNHHLMFDKYCYSINPSTLMLEGLNGTLTTADGHNLNRDYLKYHYDNYLAHSAV